MPPNGFQSHDHTACISGTLKRAEAYCTSEGLKFTPVRRRALEILLQEHRAVGAYDLLAQLAEDGHGAQPPVAYRALDFLVKAGFAHRIEALNAYIACTHAGDDHAPAFLICQKCNSVAETDTAPGKGRIWDAARAAGFKIERTVVEAQGLCPACQ
ncbi:MAG: transcriptional repressor [Roseobacter sp.]